MIKKQGLSNREISIVIKLLTQANVEQRLKINEEVIKNIHVKSYMR